MMVYKGAKRLTSRKAIVKRKAEFVLDWMVCACNNCSMYKGFYESDNKGNWKKETQKPKFLVCNHCGALISVPKGFPNWKNENSVLVKIAKFVTVNQLQLADVKQGNGEIGGKFSSDFSHIKE
jgi:hypothetical protein